MLELKIGFWQCGPLSSMFLRSYSQTDLRISVSKANFDAESDFEVHLDVDLQKPGQNSEKQNCWFNNFVNLFFSGVEKLNVGNRLKRVLVKFEAKRSYV